MTQPSNREMSLHNDQWFIPRPDPDPGKDHPRPSDITRNCQRCGDPHRGPRQSAGVFEVMFANITDLTLTNAAGAYPRADVSPPTDAFGSESPWHCNGAERRNDSRYGGGPEIGRHGGRIRRGAAPVGVKGAAYSPRGLTSFAHEFMFEA